MSLYRRLALPLMAGLLLAYAAAHSPLLRAAGRALGHDVSRCYFTCSDWAPYGRPGDAAAALVCLLAAVAAGWLAAGRLNWRSDERALGAGLLALAFVVIPASLIGFVGWLAGAAPLRPPLGPLLTALPALGFLAIGRGRRWSVWPTRPALRRPHPLILVVGATALLLLAGSALISLSHPPTGYDALSYHGPLAVYFWRDGNLGMVLDRQNWAWALSHPGTMELWAGLIRVAAGERAANLAQLPLALLAAIAVYVLARRTGLQRYAAGLGALGFLAGPMVVTQSGMQLNDLTAGALVMAAVALAAAPADQWSRSRMAMVGLALGLAATAKLATLPAVGAVVLYVALVAIRRGGLRLLLPAAAAFALVVAPWWLRNLMLYGNPIYPAALPFIGRGFVVGDFTRKDTWFVPWVAAWPLYPLLEPHGEMSGAGALFAVGILPGIAAAVMRGRRAPLVLCGLVTTLTLPAWWLLTQHEPRLILHLFGLGFAFLGWSLVLVPRPRRAAAAGVLAAAAILSALVTVDQALRPLSRAPTERSTFYDLVWGVDSVAATLGEEYPILSHTGYAKLSYAVDYPLLGPSVRRVIVSVDGELATDSIVGIMRSRGIQYAYVPAAPEYQPEVRGMYPADRFALVHSSTVTGGDRKGTERYLFRLREPDRAGAEPALP